MKIGKLIGLSGFLMLVGCGGNTGTSNGNSEQTETVVNSALQTSLMKLLGSHSYQGAIDILKQRCQSGKLKITCSPEMITTLDKFAADVATGAISPSDAVSAPIPTTLKAHAAAMVAALVAANPSLGGQTVARKDKVWRALAFGLGSSYSANPDCSTASLAGLVVGLHGQQVPSSNQLTWLMNALCLN